jgi:diguanylate cyclase (GGDEF)-like protein
MSEDPPETDEPTPLFPRDRRGRDALTGALTRSAFDERLGDVVAAALQYGESLALLMVDVDHLGSFNERYGRSAGDAALAAIAKRIASALAASDILARFDDDEFAILCRRPMRDYAVALAQRLRGKIAGGAIEIRDAGDAYLFTVSIGVCLFPAAGLSDPGAFREAAGGALRQAKANGRDRVFVADSASSGG